MIAALLAITPVAVGQRLSGTISVSAAEHRVDAGAGVEVSAGPMFTAGVEAALGRRWVAGLGATVGALSAEGGGPDRDVAQLRASLGFRAVPWLNIEAAFGTRTYSAAIARQRWTAASLGAEARLSLGGDHVAGVGRVALLPLLTVSDLEASNAGLSAAVGVEYRGGRSTIALSYWLERYDFPAAAGVVRREQLAGLMVRATWSPGKTS